MSPVAECVGRKKMVSETLGEMLVRLRKKVDLRREDVAHHVKVSLSTIVRWERDRARPGYDQMLELAELYGVDPEQFFRVKPPSSRRTEPIRRKKKKDP